MRIRAPKPLTIAQPRTTRPRGAYSLLELSVVLAIISLIAGAGMSMARNALKAADRIGTQEKLAAIQTALDSHAKTYGYLPCPAARDITPTSANFGVENRNNYTPPSQNCTSATGGITLEAATSSVVIGAVPVRTLGLPDNYAADAWGNKLTYAVSANVASEPSRIAGRNGAIVVRNGTLAVPYTITTQRTDGGNPGTYSASSVTVSAVAVASVTLTPVAASNVIVYLKSNAGSTGYNGSYRVQNNNTNPTLLLADGANYLAYNAADTGGTYEWQSAGAGATYVIVSHGPDGRGAYPLAGTAIPANKLCNTSVTANTSPPPCTSSGTATCLDIQNCNDTDAIFFDTAYNDGGIAAEYFDDFIVWGSNSLQRNAVNDALYTSGATHTCPTGVCENWCAACTSNFPQTTLGTAVTTVPPTAMLNATTIPAAVTLCKKIMTSDATTCAATCLWGGVNQTAGPIYSYYKCP